MYLGLLVVLRLGFDLAVTVFRLGLVWFSWLFAFAMRIGVGLL